ARDRRRFVVLVPQGQPPAPSYFPYDAVLNRKRRELLDESTPPPRLTLDEARTAADSGAVLLDGRTPEEFARGHLRGSINVGLEGRYAEFAGSVVPDDVDIVLVVEPGYELEAKNRLARIGFDRVVGFVADPRAVMADHPDLTQTGSRLTAPELDARRAEIDDLQLVDVRAPGEHALGSIDGARHIPVGQLPDRLDELDVTRPTVVFCAGGYRSSVAASVLRVAGFPDVSDVIGGYAAWASVVDAQPSRG
ncbi:MAG: rhodanese-like domain-containing protein, partial [Acidimicrobiales bacterium]